MGLTSITWMEDCGINSIIGILLKDLQARIRAPENSAEKVASAGQIYRPRDSVVIVASHLRLIGGWSDVRGVNTRRTHLAIHSLPNDVGVRGMKAPTNWHWVMSHEGAPGRPCRRLRIDCRNVLCSEHRFGLR